MPGEELCVFCLCKPLESCALKTSLNEYYPGGFVNGLTKILPRESSGEMTV